MKVLFDTNIVLDVLLKREPFYTSASQLMSKVEQQEIEGYLSATTITTVFYLLAKSLDKNAAQNGNWRTKESTLHMLALIGGWPGAMYAQQKLRHKSIKTEFRQVFWATVVMNISALSWVALSETGRSIIVQLMRSY